LFKHFSSYLEYFLHIHLRAKIDPGLHMLVSRSLCKFSLSLFKSKLSNIQKSSIPRTSRNR